MTASEIQILITSLIGLLVVFGGGSKWMLTYIDARQAKSALTESQAREALSAILHEEIRVLRMELATSNANSRLYLRRIYQLESFIHTQLLMPIPAMEGWPPE